MLTDHGIVAVCGVCSEGRGGVYFLNISHTHKCKHLLVGEGLGWMEGDI